MCCDESNGQTVRWPETSVASPGLKRRPGLVTRSRRRSRCPLLETVELLKLQQGELGGAGCDRSVKVGASKQLMPAALQRLMQALATETASSWKAYTAELMPNRPDDVGVMFSRLPSLSIESLLGASA